MKTLLSIATALALISPLAAGGHGQVVYERDESNPAPIQRTCVDEALSGVILNCFVDVTAPNVVYPPHGIRILDSFILSPAPSPSYGDSSHPSAVRYDPSNPDPSHVVTQNIAILGHLAYTSSYHRDTGGNAPWLLPGQHDVAAWYGNWLDDGDGEIEIEGLYDANGNGAGNAPGNEFHARSEQVLAWIEPGSHPTSTDPRRPMTHEYDIEYNRKANQLHGAHANVLFLDGSLLEPYVIETLAAGIAKPDEANGRPFTIAPGSLLDVDRYMALAPGPVTTLYQAAASPFVNAISTPGANMCPRNCVVPPLPIAPPLGAMDVVFSPYEHELGNGPRAAQPGRGQDYIDDWHAWMDVLPGMTHPTGGVGALRKTYPLPGLAYDGGIAMPPGFFHPEVRVGAWKDFTRDGHVGRVLAQDAYEGGNRPSPDDYYDHHGEWVPISGKAVGPLGFLLTPETDWGPAGVFRFGHQGLPQTNGSPCLATAPPTTLCVSDLTRNPNWIRGSDPILIPPSGSGAGHMFMTDYLFFPQGTSMGGFEVCFGPRDVTFERPDGSTVTERVSDCDWVGRLV